MLYGHDHDEDRHPTEARREAVHEEAAEEELERDELQRVQQPPHAHPRPQRLARAQVVERVLRLERVTERRDRRSPAARSSTAPRTPANATRRRRCAARCRAAGGAARTRSRAPASTTYAAAAISAQPAEPVELRCRTDEPAAVALRARYCDSVRHSAAVTSTTAASAIACARVDRDVPVGVVAHVGDVRAPEPRLDTFGGDRDLRPDQRRRGRCRPSAAS